MTKLLSHLIFLCCSIVFSQSFYDLSIESIDGDLISFSEFKGKNVLIVNVASKCGYTSQYEDLQQLSEDFDNLVILGVPCNQFANQEPKNELEIKQFCTNNYGVSFPMTKKVKVRGYYIHPVYQWLTQKKLNKVLEEINKLALQNEYVFFESIFSHLKYLKSTLCLSMCYR